MDGIILINKPKQYTSHDVVAKVKKILNIKKIGHTGTLDPNATGVLPLLLENGTKLSKYLMNHDKEYEVILKLGIKTDTADGEGKVIEEKEIHAESLKEENVRSVLQSFLGQQMQIPPMYSAIKINGKKLYEYARQGQVVDRTGREITIYAIDLLDVNAKENEIQILVSCSKGTYIRTLCEDIAKALNTVGYMKELKRLKVGQFQIQDSITLEELEKIKTQNKLEEHLITMEDIFKEKAGITLNQEQLQLFLNGVKLQYQLDDDIYKIYHENKFIGLGIIEKGILKRDIIV